MAIDPVCKMTVDEKKAPATSEYKGVKYYFCAVGCKKAFDKAPEKYLGKKYQVFIWSHTVGRAIGVGLKSKLLLTIGK